MENRLSEKLNIQSSNINFLKFLCACLVIFCHSYPITGNGADILSRVTKGDVNFGGLSVGIFFFLSGLYVAKSMNRAITIRSFVWKRICRIFPRLIIVVLLSVFALGPLLTALPAKAYFTDPETCRYLLNAVLLLSHNLPGVFSNLPYRTVNGPLWTMPVEFLCYITLALVTAIAFLFTGKDKRPSARGEAVNSGVSKAFLLLGWALCCAAFLYNFYELKNESIGMAIRPTLLFIEGCLCYVYREKIRLNPLAGIACAAWLTALAPLGYFSFGMLLLLPYAVLALALGLPQMPLNFRLFSLSYEMYLLGWPIQQVILSAAGGCMSAMANTLIALPADIVLAFLLDYFVEKLEKKHDGKK